MRIAIESPEKLSDNDLENIGIESLEELPFRCVDRCYLHVLYMYVSIISTVLKTGTLKTQRGGKKFSRGGECRNGNVLYK